MLESYFQTGGIPFSQSQWSNCLNHTTIGHILYDYMETVIHHFGPKTFNSQTPQELEDRFVDWEGEVYALITKEVSINCLEELEGEKYDLFWTKVENRNLDERYLTVETMEDVFNHSPLAYQRFYIRLLKDENRIGRENEPEYNEDIIDTDSQSSVMTADTIRDVFDDETDEEVDDDDDDEEEVDDEQEVEGEEEYEDDDDYSDMPELISDSDSEDNGLTTAEAMFVLMNVSNNNTIFRTTRI
jgi:hypothetical protein